MIKATPIAKPRSIMTRPCSLFKHWFCIIVLILALGVSSLFATDPVVSNVTASQRTDGSKIVDIWYDLEFTEVDSVFITLTISEDAGENFNIIPAPANLTGDIRFVTQPGNGKHIVWSMGAESRSFDAISFVFKAMAVATVANVSFDPPGGIYQTAQNVILSTATPGATIRYTIDGSEPGPSSALYTEAISISSPTTLKAKAYKTNWQASETVISTYVIISENFVLIPGGTFTMGRTTGTGDSDEIPTHSVTLSSFYMCKYEVTQGEYQHIMGSNPAHSYGVGANYPVYCVSWYAILKYCNLRSMAEGLTPVYSISGSTNPANWGDVPTSDNETWNAAICNWSANGYRLPTEAEWEYAARGATNTPDYLYSGSDDINAVAWYNGNSPHGSKPVGTKAPNGLGLYDMSGNLWEWCWDWYSSSYYSSSPQNNPTGPASGSYRVVRAGAWGASAFASRVAYRLYECPDYSHTAFGIRLCRASLNF